MSGTGSGLRAFRIPKATVLIDTVTLILFPALMAYSAWSDLFTMRIGNWISVLLVMGFVCLAMASGMSLATLGLAHLSCGAAVLVLTFALFAFGWIGGGDAKLAAATAVWIGWPHLADYGLLASILGAGLTLAILRFRKQDLPARWLAQSWIARLHNRTSGVPYGVALACAGLTLYPETTLWHSVVGV